MEEIDSKEASDALHMLLHCSLKDTEFETQKEQFEIVNTYIKKLEKHLNFYENNKSYKLKIIELKNEVKELKSENYELNNRINDLLDSIPKSVIEEDIEKIGKRVKGEVTLSKYDQLTIGECLLVKKLLHELLEKGNK